MVSEASKVLFSSWYLYLIFGMIFGSFLNVVIYRVPNGLSIVSPPSSCPKCGHMIKWYENIPVISWIFLKAKCSSCGLPISFEYPLVELISGSVATGLFFYTGPSVELIFYIALAYTLLCIMIIDFKTYSIPHGLNITLLIISVLAILTNLSGYEFLPAGLSGSLLGGLTGFGILYAIQKVGKIIYQQEAMGMGDLFLLGSAGLMLGPKLTLTAFIIGSLLAVVSYAVPSVLNLMKRKKETYRFINIAQKMNCSEIKSIDKNADILGLKLQLFRDLNKDIFEKTKKELLELLKDNEPEPEVCVRLFFRYAAIDDSIMASDMLKKIESAGISDTKMLNKVLSEDLIGYDSYIDNLKLMHKFAVENSLEKLSSSLTEMIRSNCSGKLLNSISEIRSEADKLKTKTDRLDFLLLHNRYFQFNGYTSEQKHMIEMIEKEIDPDDAELMQKYLSDTALVYYKDFFFRESEIALDKLKRTANESQITFDSLKNIYNIALFRLVFFKQRLAFGPFLSAGIMISLLWGERIINSYAGLLEKIIE
ncbi:MAG: prepilin peptidase [Candidatus Delongbacteria bacterium]|nr:prepilin peptidase [Candidatus Delongbacteria bacterium]